ncbi:MAG TPA: Glu/Leu/Phe/Val dehydrogenase dimerization domain-containing protein [Pyrinomonadaceae bacterium]|nr:Glu/Leu/Phe/Val dehydrogenase dimerization domain-containing protein [Pyrinomonadaceae bacterium]
MYITERETGGEYELLVTASDPEAGYRGVIAVHSTRLGPAVGGTRFWHYASEEEAVTDALRLARGMTYKNALAGLPLGGGKSVIIGDNRTPEREAIFRAHGRFVEHLGGRYITAEDVGTSPEDMEFIRRETNHVAGLLDRSGDPSPVTARGVFRAVQAAARARWGSDELAGRRVALQGCGHVGYHLARELRRAGAELIVADTDEERVRRVVEECGAERVAPEEIYFVEADVFAPCALGGVLNDRTIPALRVGVVAGAANNQLLEARHGAALERAGILYAPDYVANAGGIINGCIELLGWERGRARRQVEEIYDTLLRVFEIARRDGVPTSEAADRLAEERLRDGIK